MDLDVFMKFENIYKEKLKSYNDNKDLLISEGLILSWSVIDTVKTFKSNNKIKNLNVDQTNDMILMIIKITDFDKKTFEKDLNLTGYFIGRKITYNNDYYRILIEPKYPFFVDVTRKYEKLFHITNIKNLDKIKKIGLTPKTTNRTDFKHPSNRIYLFATPNYKDLKDLKNVLKQSPNDKMAVITIPTENLNGWDFYNDPRMKNFTENSLGLFTLKNIPPNFLIF